MDLDFCFVALLLSSTLAIAGFFAGCAAAMPAPAETIPVRALDARPRRRRPRLLSIIACAALSVTFAVAIRQQNVPVFAAGAAFDGAASRPNGALSGVPRLAQTTRYAIDVVHHDTIDTAVAEIWEPLVVKRGTILTVDGWAIDEVHRSTAGGVLAVIDGYRARPAQYGINRGDVAQALLNAHYAHSGFSAIIDTRDLEEGPHTLTFAILNRTHSGYYPAQPSLNVIVFAPAGANGD